MTLADGSFYIASTSVSTDFVGFISNGAAISSLTMNAVGTGNVYVTADNMYFGVVGVVPAPGAVALIGLAGLVASRRRRN